MTTIQDLINDDIKQWISDNELDIAEDDQHELLHEIMDTISESLNKTIGHD